MKGTLLQKGFEGSDLFVYCHIDPNLLTEHVKTLFPGDAVWVELRGEGTSAYRGVSAEYGGWDRWVDTIEKKCGCRFARHFLTTWSAGSQVVKDVCLAGYRPDGILMLDGLYEGKPPSSKTGDGKITVSEYIEAISQYATDAAREDSTTKFIATYSDIMTPYASSRECQEWIRARVEGTLGYGIGPDLSIEILNGRKITESFRTNGFRQIGTKGHDAAEHCFHAHLYRELWKVLKDRG